jgi:hypothetical protein
MITKIAYRTALACAILTSASPSLAQDGPSYEETLQFLEDKTNVQYGSAPNYSRYRLETRNHCELRYIYENIINNEIYASSIFTV